jgi:enamine deaminase RidA (YjgF/YER057c/UK114 family)
MKSKIAKASLCAAAALLFATAGFAADRLINREQEPNAPWANYVAVPPGYTIYFMAGAASEKGDTTEEQARTTLAEIKEKLGKQGLTFANVVQAQVFLAGDPAKGGHMDWDGMNKAWFEQFGTAAQPNKPARAAFQVAALAGPHALVEMQMTAVKKTK